MVSGSTGGVCAANCPRRVARLVDPDTQPDTASSVSGLPRCVSPAATWGTDRAGSVLQLVGAKSSTYAPDGTCARLSVLRIAGYGTAVLP